MTASRWLAKVPDVALGASVIGVTVLLLAEVMLRYLLHLPLAWADEAANFLFVWMAMLGAAVAVKRKAHMMSTLIVGRMSPRSQRFARLTAVLVTITFGLFLLVVGYEDAMLNMHQRMLVSGIPHGWLIMAIPVAGALIVVYGVGHLRAELQRRKVDYSGATSFFGG